MNKILGILLFVIIVVSSASIAFAYDPGVTSDDNSGGDFLAAGSGDNQTLYNDALIKKNVYNSVVNNKTNYSNESDYFNALTDAWGDYIDALALYDNSTNATDLKDQLSFNIESYLNKCAELELKYNNSVKSQEKYNGTLADFANIKNDPSLFDSYFTQLYTDFENYLIALTLYDENFDSENLLIQLNNTIGNYTTTFNTLETNFNKTVEAKEAFEYILDSLDYSDVIEVIKDGFFSELISAFHEYLNALALYQNTTYDIALMQNLTDSISYYLAPIKHNQELIDNITETKDVYDFWLANITGKYELNEEISSSDFENLVNAFEAYVVAYNLYDSTFDFTDLRSKLLAGIAVYNGTANKNDFAILANASKDVYDFWLANITGKYELKEEITSADFENLVNAFEAYVVAYNRYDSSFDFTDLRIELLSAIDAYNTTDTNNKKIPTIEDALNNYNALKTVVEGRVKLNYTIAQSEFDALYELLEKYVDAWFEYNGTNYTSLLIDLNNSVIKYFKDLTDTNQRKYIDGLKEAYYGKLDILKEFLKENLVSDPYHYLFNETRVAWYNYVKAMSEYDDSIDLTEKLSELENSINTYIDCVLEAIGYIGGENNIFENFKDITITPNGFSQEKKVYLVYNDSSTLNHKYYPPDYTQPGADFDAWGFTVALPDYGTVFSFCADIGALLATGTYEVDMDNRGFSDDDILYLVAAIDYIFEKFEYPKLTDSYDDGFKNCYALTQIVVWNFLLKTGDTGFAGLYFDDKHIVKILGDSSWYNEIFASWVDFILDNKNQVIELYSKKLSNNLYEEDYVNGIGFLLGNDNTQPDYNQQRQIFVRFGRHENFVMPEFPDADDSEFIYPKFEAPNGYVPKEGKLYLELPPVVPSSLDEFVLVLPPVVPSSLDEFVLVLPPVVPSSLDEFVLPGVISSDLESFVLELPGVVPSSLDEFVLELPGVVPSSLDEFVLELPSIFGSSQSALKFSYPVDLGPFNNDIVIVLPNREIVKQPDEIYIDLEPPEILPPIIIPPNDPEENLPIGEIQEGIDNLPVEGPQNPGNNKPNADALNDSPKDDSVNKSSAQVGSMKNTGLPIGIIVALVMSILIVIRVKK